MPNGETLTGKIATLTLGDSKKSKMARHAASGSGGAMAVILMLNQFPGLVPYVIADDDYTKTRDSVIEIRTEVRQTSTEFKEFKQETKQDSHEIKKMLYDLSRNAGIVPTITKDTVYVRYLVPRGDTMAVSYWKKSPTVDSFFTPQPDTNGHRPR